MNLPNSKEEILKWQLSGLCPGKEVYYFVDDEPSLVSLNKFDEWLVDNWDDVQCFIESSTISNLSDERIFIGFHSGVQHMVRKIDDYYYDLLSILILRNFDKNYNGHDEL